MLIYIRQFMLCTMNKKIAIVVGGWHYPYKFYEVLSKQELPNDWDMDLFIIGHRIPPGIKKEKENIKYHYDKELYKRFLELDDLKKLNYKYHLMPNTIGDLEYVNQWLKIYNYKDYDIIHFTHDDNYIKEFNCLKKILSGDMQFYKKDSSGIKTIKADESNWLILSNSTTESFYHVRVSSIFFKKEVFDLLDNGFDLSHIKLNRIGEINTPTLHSALSEWNGTVGKLNELIKNNNLFNEIKYLSPYYRVSPYCIEGERGLISKKLCWKKEFENGMKEFKYEL